LDYRLDNKNFQEVKMYQQSQVSYGTRQTLVSQLRTIWYKMSSFEVEKIGQFLNSQFAM